MLQRDYMEQEIERFLQSVGLVIRQLIQKPDELSVEELEAALTEFIGIPGILRMQGESFVMMMNVGGVGDLQSDYVCHSLLLLSEAYKSLGNASLAEERSAQAQAVATAFGVDLDETPEVFRQEKQDRT